jgi:CHRD domain
VRWLRLALAVIFVFSLAPAGVSAQDDQPGPHGVAYVAVMTNQAEVPPTPGAGRGIASFVLSSDGALLYFSVSVTDLSSPARAAHIHLGSPGANGDVIVNLCGAGSTPRCASDGLVASGTIDSSALVGPMAGRTLEDLLAVLETNATYANVHSDRFPNGEIRGQVRSLQADDGSE